VNESCYLFWVNVIQAAAIIILTAALVEVRYWYATHTKRMAEIMAKDYEIRISPILDVSRVVVDGSFPEIKISFDVKNIGTYVSYIRDIQSSWYMVEQPAKKASKILQTGEIQLNPEEPKSIPVRLDRDDFAKLDINTTPGVYSVSIHIKVQAELEIAGPDRKFVKRYMRFTEFA